MSPTALFIWQDPAWPGLHYDAAATAGPLSEVSRGLGLLAGRLADQPMEARERAMAAALTEDAVKTSAIEGEVLDLASVRSSVARRLGLEAEGLSREDRQADGVVAMLMDAITRSQEPLTDDRLKAWQALLFQTPQLLRSVVVGDWRDDRADPMRVVSGPVGREKVHFQAPPAERVDAEVAAFLDWFENDQRDPWVIKSALAHLWIVTIHPFEDGNGRVSRAVADMALSRVDGMPERYYSVSSQLKLERSDYYDQLERAQKGSTDVTGWVVWYLECVSRALRRAGATLDTVLTKVRFWTRWQDVSLNERQKVVLNRVLDEIEEPLTNRKWAKLAGVSSDTALRDLSELVEHGLLTTSGTGKGRRYHLQVA